LREMSFGHWRISRQVCCRVADPVHKLQLPGIDASQHGSGQRQLEHAAHQEALVTAVGKLPPSLRVQREHAKATAVARFERKKRVFEFRESKQAAGSRGGYDNSKKKLSTIHRMSIARKPEENLVEYLRSNRNVCFAGSFLLIVFLDPCVKTFACRRVAAAERDGRDVAVGHRQLCTLGRGDQPHG
jgi:hypothetical protein